MQAGGLYVYLVTGKGKPFWVVWGKPGVKALFKVARSLKVITLPQSRGQPATARQEVAPRGGVVSIGVGSVPVLVE